MTLNMNYEVLFVILLIKFSQVVSQNEHEDAGVVFDQRQTGKYNIHLSFKDVSFVSLTEDDLREKDNGGSFANDDDYYDDNDLTVKPFTDLKPTPSLSPLIAFLTNNANKSTTMEPQFLYNLSAIFANSTLNQAQNPVLNTTHKPSVIILTNNTDPSPILTPIRNETHIHQPEAQVPVHIIMEAKRTALLDALRSETNRKKVPFNRPGGVFNGRKVFPSYRRYCSNGYDKNGNCVKLSFADKLMSLLTSVQNDSDVE